MSFHLPPTIMIVDPDPVSRTSASNALERNGFNVIASDSGNDALKKLKRLAETGIPNIIVVNNELNDLSGIELCTILRTKRVMVPIIMLALKEDGIQDLKGTTNAFDDYITKPLNNADLIYKIKMLLGRTRPNLQSKVIEFQDIQLNLASYKVTRAGRPVHLGPTEFKLLQCFVENPTKIFSRKDLIEYIWADRNDVEVRTIDVHINRLRTALKLPNEHIPIIKTVRAAGYCLSLSEKIYINA